MEEMATQVRSYASPGWFVGKSSVIRLRKVCPWSGGNPKRRQSSCASVTSWCGWANRLNAYW